MTFKIIEPINIGDGDIVSCTIAEDDAPPWFNDATYTQGQDVVYSHRVWKSTADGNLGNTPSASSTWWSDQGATMQWRAFDSQLTPRVNSQLDITYVISPSSGIDAVGICYANASEVTVSTADGYSRTISTDTFKRTLIFDDIPRTTSNVTITLTVRIGYARVGEIVLGNAYDLGICRNVRFELVESQDDFVKFVQRFTYTVVVDKSDVEDARNRLFDLQESYAVFTGAPDNPEFGSTIFAKMSDHAFQVTPSPKVIADIEVDSAP